MLSLENDSTVELIVANNSVQQREEKRSVREVETHHKNLTTQSSFTSLALVVEALPNDRVVLKYLTSFVWNEMFEKQ